MIICKRKMQIHSDYDAHQEYLCTCLHEQNLVMASGAGQFANLKISTSYCFLANVSLIMQQINRGGGEHICCPPRVKPGGGEVHIHFNWSMLYGLTKSCPFPMVKQITYFLVYKSLYTPSKSLSTLENIKVSVTKNLY